MTSPSLSRSAARLLGLALLLAAVPLGAQQPTGAARVATTSSVEPLSDSARTSVLTGRVTTDEGVAIVGAEVTLLASGRAVRTDAQGDFNLTELGAGPTRILVRRLGFVPGNFTVLLGAAERREVRVTLAVMPIQLVEVRVHGARAAEFGQTSSRYTDFRARRSVGNGHFWDRSEFAKFQPQRMTDIFQRTPGLRLNRDRQGRTIVSARGNSAGRSCPMRLFVDGFSVPLFGLSIDDFVQVGDVEAIEVYSGLGTIPAQFSGRGPTEDSRCGVVVVWTRVE